MVCDVNRARTAERVENWWDCLEDAGLKVSRSKTEHLPPPANLQPIELKGYEGKGSTNLPSVTIFKYLGATIGQQGECEKEVAKRIEKTWNRWGKLTGVVHDRKIPTKLKVLL